ncbi:MAG TPA: two-component regulator propeller domain-containing protein [Bacteroidales bacterium]|nr:two-component regulator propeller domain-containing protein [Bacteroidales bacterium]
MRRSLTTILVFIGLWIIIFPTFLCAQEFLPKFRQYSSAEGLSQSVVLTIFQDSKNFLWFGTEDGLNKFDGYNFKVYRYNPEDSLSISDNWVEQIYLEDSDGDLWMETGDRNINVFNLKTDRFVKIIPSSKGTDGLLPFQRIFFIKQDKRGSVWISTDKGLFCVNKKDWKIRQVFVNTNKDRPRLFRYLLNDDKQHMWIGSNRGLFVGSYNASKEAWTFTEKYNDQPILGIEKAAGAIWVVTEQEIAGFNHTANQFKTISFASQLAPFDGKHELLRERGLFGVVKKDRQNNIWVCTLSGLIFFDTKAQQADVYLNRLADNSSISSNVVTTMYEDSKGSFWIGTANGVNQFIAQTKSFRRLLLKTDSFVNNIVVSIYEDKAGKIWVKNQSDQMEGSQLFYLDQKSMQFTQVLRKNNDHEGLPVDLTYEPFIDHQGNIWYGTYGAGILLYAPPQKKFEVSRHIPGNANTLAGNSCWAISEDSKGRLWIALSQDGLDNFDPVNGKLTHYKDKISSFLGVKNFYIISAICDRNNRVWIGTKRHGIICMDIPSGKMILYQDNPNSPYRISGNLIMAITIDPKGNLLISYSEGGLDILNPTTGKLETYRNIAGDYRSLYNSRTRYAIGTSDGNYWISSDGAITFFDRSRNKMTHYLARKTGGKGILSDKASCIFEDSKGNIWVGTHGGGLSLFDKKKQEFKYWTEKDGLANNVVYGILEDKAHRLWLSTNKGISCFNPVTSKFLNYYANDGLQASEFNANSFYKTRNGKMYFGGINGITSFFPQDIQPDPVPPRIAITGFQIFNKKVEVLPFEKRNLIGKESEALIDDGEHIYLPEDISYTKKLKLSYSHKVITFEFTALRFDMPERCTFKYKMEGFEKEWNIAGHRRYATYTNLPPGDYLFKVTAANADGVWNPEPVVMEISIRPPFYLTWWFIVFAVAFLIVTSLTIVRRREQNLKRSKSILEEKVKLRTHELNEKNEELTLRNMQISKQKEEIATQAKRLRAELDIQNQTSEQALLRSQINPHFLFNTLNNIYSLVYKKAPEAPEAVMKLSEIMRYMLYDTSADLVLLDKEIQYLHSFIALQLLRMKNRDYVSFEVSGDPLDKKIAPMLLIPFVENAFKHGNKSAQSPGIIIKLGCTNEEISLQVQNNKNKSATKDAYGGIGLANVKRRLELIYHDKYKLNIKDTADSFEVDLSIRQN